MIRGESDVITTRMYVREVARRYGMSLSDQACISLAMSSLAYHILDKARFGEIEGSVWFEYLEKGSRLGMKVVSMWKGFNYLPALFNTEQWMVDEIDTQQVDDGIQVVLTKWGSASSLSTSYEI